MQDDLDRLIDSGLAAYSSVEPLAGLDKRVLQRVRTVRRRRWWALVLVPAAAVVLAILPSKHAPGTVAEVVPPPPAVQPTREPIRTATVRQRLPRAPRRPRPVRSNPKREFFPTLTPLTAEEEGLLELARTKPKEVLPPPAQDLEIKPIEIAPLVPDGRP